MTIGTQTLDKTTSAAAVTIIAAAIAIAVVGNFFYNRN